MSHRRPTRILSAGLLATAAGVMLAALWAMQRQRASLEPRAVEQKRPSVVVLPPSDESFDHETALTAAPRVEAYRFAAAGDYESLSPDELSSAFLVRATESWNELEPGELGDEAEMDGFQITTIETLTEPELSDDPIDFEIPGYRRARG